MAKPKKVYVCSNCGHQELKEVYKCVACTEWNTFHEEIIDAGNKMEQARKALRTYSKKGSPKPIILPEIKTGATKRNITPDEELNRVLGGGIVSGSIILIGGQPGIGKSTLLLQVALQLKKKVLYVSGEESQQQINCPPCVGLHARTQFPATDCGKSRKRTRNDSLFYEPQQ